jgi:hypothetical protein
MDPGRLAMGRILATMPGSCSMLYSVPIPHHYFGPTNVIPQPCYLHHIPAPLAVYPLHEFRPTLLPPSPPNPSSNSVSSRKPIRVGAKPKTSISRLLVITLTLYLVGSIGPSSQSTPRSFLPVSHHPLPRPPVSTCPIILYPSYQTFLSPDCRRHTLCSASLTL